jgi:two-component system, sensor histidine kinase ChiS
VSHGPSGKMPAMAFRTPLTTFAASFIATATVFAASASELPGCAAPGASRPLPDPAVCLRQAGVTARGATTADSVRSLFKRAGEEIDAGRYAETERVLDCADAAIGANGEVALRYELVRQRGIFEYQRDYIPEALSRFECALKISNASEDHIAIARDLKNVGSALRRLGDFRGALDALLRALEIQRANGKPSGAVLNNLADVYRELEKHDEALRFYREAQAAFDGEGKPIEVAHTLENMAALQLDRGNDRDADALLRDALAVYRKNGNRQHELLIHESLTREALARGDLAQAQTWSASAIAIASEHDMELPPLVRLQIARTERLSGRPDAARAQLNAAMGAVSEENGAQAPFLEELAALAESTGDAGAMRTLRKAHEQAMKHARAQYDLELNWMRTRFETEDRERRIDDLETENRLRAAALRQRTLLLWLMGAVLLIGALSFWLWRQRRRHAERMQQELQRAHHEQELARYRRETDALAEDRHLLQTLLDSRQDAVCLLDAEGGVLAANRAAVVLLGAENDTLAGRALMDTLSDPDGAALASALERMEDNLEQQVGLRARDGAPLLARLAPWAGGDGLVVLMLQAENAFAPIDDSASQAAGVVQAAPTIEWPTQTLDGEHTRALSLESQAADLDDPGLEVVSERMPEAVSERDGGRDTEAMRQDFRRILVELMLATVDAWERATATSRLELAEKSRIWRVNIDDGRLRARAMERYLGVSKLPRNPRWRDVIRTTYYVLGQCEGLSESVRVELQARIDALLAYTRRDALV